MSDTQTNIEKSTIFAERSDAGLAEAFDILSSPPKRELAPDAKERTLQFYDGLISGEAISAALKISKLEGTIQDVVKRPMTGLHPTFAAEYFLTKDGKEQAGELGIDLYGTNSATEVEEALLRFDFTSLDAPSKVDSMATKSAQFVEVALATHVIDGTTPKVHPTRFSVITDPFRMARNISTLSTYREGMRVISRELKTQPESDERDAKILATKQVRARVNELLANYLADLSIFSNQIEYLPDDVAAEFAEIMTGVANSDLYVAAQEQTKARIGRRLDKVRNGVNVVRSEDDNVEHTAVNLAIYETEKSPEPSLGSEALFSPEEVEKLATTEIGNEELVDLLEFMLNSHELLSDELPDDSIADRVGRAKDGKWQVFVDNKAKNLSVDSSRGIMRVPPAFNRPIFQKSPAGAATAAVHEFRHVLQNEIVDAAQKSGAELPAIVTIKTARSSAFREGDAVREESQALNDMFSAERDVATQYSRAMDAFEVSGGDEVLAARAFYEDLMQKDPSRIKEATAMLAINRVQRFLMIGGYNTQPMVYPEQTEISERLGSFDKNEARKIGLLSGAMSIQEAARLHEFGLLSAFEAVEIPDIDTTILISEWIREHYL